MAISTDELTVKASDIMSRPLRQRQEMANRGLLDVMLSTLTPGQIAATFPSYIKDFTTGKPANVPAFQGRTGGVNYTNAGGSQTTTDTKKIVSAWGASQYPDPKTGQPTSVKTGYAMSKGSFISPIQGIFSGGPNSAHGAQRDGGTRLHSGTDWQAPTGSNVVFPVGGKVLYHGWNKGYEWNVTILGDDGNIYRLAPHGAIGDFKVGQRVGQGDVAGVISDNHLHMELIKPTTDDGKPNSVFQDMVKNLKTGQNNFIDTINMRGTSDLAEFLNLAKGVNFKQGDVIIKGPDDPEAMTFVEANKDFLGDNTGLPTAELVLPGQPQNATATPLEISPNDASGLMSTVTNPTGDSYQFAPVSYEDFFDRLGIDLADIAKKNNGKVPQGMRHNNPGNLKAYEGVDWDGAIGVAGSDQGQPQVEFSNPLAGTRALARLILNKYNGVGNNGRAAPALRTIQQLITDRSGLTPGFSPAAANIAKAMGVNVNAPIDLSDPVILKQFMIAYVNQEQAGGAKFYPDQMFDQAIALVTQPNEGNTALADFQKVAEQAKRSAEILPTDPQIQNSLPASVSDAVNRVLSETAVIKTESQPVATTPAPDSVGDVTSYGGYIPGGTNAAAGGAEINKPYFAQPIDGAGPNILMGETGPETITPRHRADDFGMQQYQMPQLPAPEPAKSDIVGAQNIQQPQYLPKPSFAQEPNQTPIVAEHTPIPPSLRKQYADAKMQNRLDNLSPIGSVYSNFGYA